MRNLAVHGSSQIHLKMGWQRNIQHSVVVNVVICCNHELFFQMHVDHFVAFSVSEIEPRSLGKNMAHFPDPSRRSFQLKRIRYPE